MRILSRIIILSILLALLPHAQAWQIGPGVEIEMDNTLVIVNTTIEVATDAYFQGGIFYIAPFGFGFQFTNPHTWYLENWSAPLNVTISGNATEDGSISFRNFQGIYQVEGLQGYPTFLIPGPSFDLVIPTGTTNFTVRLASISGASPIQLTMSAAWSPLNDTVFAVATLLDNFGNAWSSLGMTSTLLRPDGSSHSVINMTETIVTGVYNANHAVAASEPNGTWTVTANLGTTVASYVIIKQGAPISPGDTVEITTAFDAYVPLIIWGVSLIFALYRNAWFPAIMSFASLTVSAIPGQTFMPLALSIVLFAITWVVHSAIVNGFIPAPWASNVKK